MNFVYIEFEKHIEYEKNNQFKIESKSSNKRNN